MVIVEMVHDTLTPGDSEIFPMISENRGRRASARRGERLFFGERLECYHCHGGFLFSDNVMHARLIAPEVGFHDTGVARTGGIGEHDHALRWELAEALAWLGPFELVVVPADEEGVIARSCRRASGDYLI